MHFSGEQSMEVSGQLHAASPFSGINLRGRRCPQTTKIPEKLKKIELKHVMYKKL
jgi:hypothetical protein